MAARLTTYLVVAIVGATLIAGLIVGAQRNDTDGPIDIIVHNGAVYAADGSNDRAEAVAVRGNQVLRVGSDREILRLRRPQTVVVDAKGGAVLPGFNDADAPLIEGGLALEAIDLAGATGLDEVQARIRAWLEANPDRPWAIGRGWDPAVVPADSSPRVWLDAVVPDRPAAMLSADGGTAWVNARTIEAMAPPRGRESRKRPAAEGKGLLTGADLQRLAAVQPRPSRAARTAAFLEAVAEAHRHGITSVQHLGASAEDLEVYAEARRDGELEARVYAAIPLGGARTEAEIARLDAIASKYPDDPLLKAGAVLIAVDGSLAGGTAAMLQPLSNQQAASEPLIAPDDLNRVVRLLDARGWQVIVHAAGDRAVRMALDAFEHAARSNPAPARGRRHRIEGAEVVDPADLARAKALGAVVSIAAPATIGDEAMHAWNGLLGPERAPLAWPLGSAVKAGVRLVSGSGWPARPLNPLLAVHGEVTRTGLAGEPADGWNASERLTVERAVDARTSTAAYASFDEHRKGTLQPGMLADLVVLSQDIFTIPASRLAGVEVAATIFDGRLVYQRARTTP